LSSTSNPAPAHKESLKDRWHRQREERRAKKQQDKAKKQNEKKEHERQKLLKKHRQDEARFLVGNAAVEHGHLHGKELKRALAAKEKELLEKEKLAAARSQTASSLPHTGNPLPGSPSSLPPLDSRSGVAIPPRMN
jgi:superfamily II DNA or RNA helicase